MAMSSAAGAPGCRRRLAGGDRGEAVSAPETPRADGQVAGAAPAAGDPGLPGRRPAVIDGPRRAHQERPGPVAMSPVPLLQLVILVAGGVGQQHTSRGPGERTRNAPGRWPCHRRYPCSRCSWLPAGAGSDRGKPVSAPGTPRAGGHVTGAAPAAGAPGCRRRLAVIEGSR